MAADREFIGPECRQAPGTPAAFIPLIRIRSNALVGPKKASQPVHKLFHVKTLRILRKPRKLYGQWLYLAGMQLPNGDFFILATTAYLSNIALLYAQRWQIETLFGAYKSRGFQGEDCRVTQHRRIHTLLFVLAISLIWAIRTGQWLIRQGQGIIQKRFKKDQHKRPLLSVFRHGLDHLQDVVLNHADFQNLTMLLSCT